MDRAAGFAGGILSLLFISGLAAAETTAPLYVTWHPWQVDSVLAAWALKRFVFMEAGFASVPKGTPIAAGQALDIPDSAYRRNGLRTAYEEVLRLHHLVAPCAERLRPIARVLELAQWRKSEYPEAENFEAGLLPLLPTQPTGDGLTPAFAYIDQFCLGKGDFVQ